MNRIFQRMKQVAPMLLFATLSVHAQKSPQDMNRFIDNLMKKMTLEEMRRRPLHITYIDKGQKSVQMPFLALKRDTVGDHPIINDLCRDDFTASTLFLCIGDGRGGHRSVNVLRDRLQI